ncbi:MAG: hypothetical protein NTX08_07455 [Sphingobacteriales bacterium]|nr:hypothetical protein [Sphingobacteriales bacterium]
MRKHLSYILFLITACTLFQVKLTAQDKGAANDTFFLAKKKGLLGKLGKSISLNGPQMEPVKVEQKYLRYRGKIIRNIELVSLGFQYNINDTCEVKSDFGVRVAKQLHVITRGRTIARNLFFKEGDKLYPSLLADNERYLRDLGYLQDARFQVDYSPGTTDSVDIIIFTKDIFSLGAKVVIDSKDKGRVELKEENVNGSGSQVMLSGLYDKQRNPQTGYGAEIIQRNIGGSFIDWTVGYKNHASAFSSGRNEETRIYTVIEKPLVTPYIPSTGALQLAYFKTSNLYVSDSLYRSDIQYEFYNIDGWMGYSLDSKSALYANKEIDYHRFIALRVFDQRFRQLPGIFFSKYDYRYTDFTGALASVNFFKQTFYKTNFIYGFGRNEDVPEGFSVAVTGGYLKRQNVQRPYAGIDAELTNFKKNFHNQFIFRAGGYFFRNRFEDVNLLFQVEHFSKLKALSATWFHRTFITTGISAQVNPVLNGPLLLTSTYGLDYFNNGDIASDLRGTIKAESVFYNTHKYLGFRFAPFIFGDFCALKQVKMGLDKTVGFGAIGAGVRTRNENLSLGTIELKGYYIPRTNDGMKGWKIELNSNIRFKYKTSFISRPDAIISN